MEMLEMIDNWTKYVADSATETLMNKTISESECVCSYYAMKGKSEIPTIFYRYIKLLYRDLMWVNWDLGVLHPDLGLLRRDPGLLERDRR